MGGLRKGLSLRFTLCNEVLLATLTVSFSRCLFIEKTFLELLYRRTEFHTRVSDGDVFRLCVCVYRASLINAMHFVVVAYIPYVGWSDFGLIPPTGPRKWSCVRTSIVVAIFVIFVV